jgi:3-oxoacyl-[acyl-carrier protein] reductase
MSMKNTLVISGNGDIGTSISDEFSKKSTVTSSTRSDLDLSSKDSVDNYLKSIVTIYDNVIFCAADNKLDYFESNDIESIQKSFDINFMSFIKIVHYLITKNLLSKSSSIVLISSLYSRYGRVGRFPYSVSKHALQGIMKNLALELSQYDIRVNSITPGFIDTKLTRNNLSKEDIVKLETRIPLKRLGNVKDISNMALYLCSEKASYLTGQDITIDGGFIAGGFFENN